MEKLQNGSTMSLEQHASDVAGAIAAAVADPGAPQNFSGGANLSVDAGLVAGGTAMAGIAFGSESMFLGGLASGFVSGYDGYSDNKGSSSNNKNKKHDTQSIFVGGKGPTNQVAKTSIMPLTYTQRVALGRDAKKLGGKGPQAGGTVFAGSLMEAAATTSQSVTGSCTSSNSRMPPKGAKMDLAAAQAAGLTEFVAEWNLTMSKINGDRYGNNGALLEKELLEGKSSAKAAAKENPKTAMRAVGINVS